MLVLLTVIYILDRCEANLSLANKYNLYKISFRVILHRFAYKMWCGSVAYIIRNLEFRLWKRSFVCYHGRYYKPVEIYLTVGSVGKYPKTGSKVDQQFVYEIVLLARIHCFLYEEFKHTRLVQIPMKPDNALRLLLNSARLRCILKNNLALWVLKKQRCLARSA